MQSNRRTALLAFAGLATACAVTPSEDGTREGLDDELDPESLAPTLEEVGVHHGLGFWIPSIGAYRGHNVYDGWYRCWPDDNAMMLMAYADPRYAWARSVGLPHAIRDFLLDLSLGEGRFDEGRLVHTVSGAVVKTNPTCSPFSSSLVLHGIIEFTRRYPNASGRRAAKHYAEFIDRQLKAQHKAIMARQAGKPCATSGAQPQHNFTEPSTIAFHVQNATVWGKHAGDATIRKLAEQAWPLLSPRQRSDGGFKNSLRDAQILYALSAAIGAGFTAGGVVAARNRLDKSLTKGTNGGLLAGNEKGAGSLDTQANSYHLLTATQRPFSATAFLRNRLCFGGGYAWLGKAGRTGPGPIEDQGMGLLGAAHVARRGWSLAGVTC